MICSTYVPLTPTKVVSNSRSLAPSLLPITACLVILRKYTTAWQLFPWAEIFKQKGHNSVSLENEDKIRHRINLLGAVQNLAESGRALGDAAVTKYIPYGIEKSQIIRYRTTDVSQLQEVCQNKTRVECTNRWVFIELLQRDHVIVHVITWTFFVCICCKRIAVVWVGLNIGDNSNQQYSAKSFHFGLYSK